MTITYRITEMEQNIADAWTTNPFAPNALYSYTIYSPDIRWSTGSSIEYHQLQVLLNFWNLQLPKQLEGRTFEVPDTHRSATVAFDYLLVQAKRGGDYVFPTDEQLYKKAIIALAQLQCPDFSNEDGETEFRAFYKVFNGGRYPDPEWFISFCQQITEHSGGTVIVLPGNFDEFPSA